jgi:hypothetical protein
LEELFQSDFGEGKMGCAQETLTDILAYIHREYMHPNYLEEYFLMLGDTWIEDKAARDFQFEINKNLDDQGCSPKCPAHLTFGLDFCEISSCKKCDLVDNISQIKREYCHPLYIEELFETQEVLMASGVKQVAIDFPLLVKSILQNENQFHMSYADIRVCETCKDPVQVSDRWLLDTPNVYTFSL